MAFAPKFFLILTTSVFIDATIIAWQETPYNKKSPLAGRETEKMTLDLLFTQDQGSFITDGINHLRNLLLSTDFGVYSVHWTHSFLYFHNTSGWPAFQDGMFHKNHSKKLEKVSIDFS